LEHFQKARKEASNQSEFSDLESDDAISNPDEVSDEPSAAPEELIPGEPQDDNTPRKVPDTSLTPPQPDVETKQVVVPIDVVRWNKPTETVESSPLPPENSVPNAGVNAR
jgi:hypothetical protein